MGTNYFQSTKQEQLTFFFYNRQNINFLNALTTCGRRTLSFHRKSPGVDAVRFNLGIPSFAAYHTAGRIDDHPPFGHLAPATGRPRELSVTSNIDDGPRNSRLKHSVPTMIAALLVHKGFSGVSIRRLEWRRGQNYSARCRPNAAAQLICDRPPKTSTARVVIDG